MIQVEKIFSKSILASVLISFSSIIYLLNTNIVGAIISAIFILSIIIYNCNLFTFKAGFLSESSDFRRLTLILLLNIFTIFIIGIIVGIYNTDIASKADNIIQVHLNDNYLLIIIKSMIIGFLLTFAYETYRQYSDNYIYIIISVLCIFGFITTDYYHCITEVFYYGASNIFYDNIGISLLQLLLIILFNFIGCNLYNLFINKTFMYYIK